MKKLNLTALAAASVLCLLPACPGDSNDDSTTATTQSTPATPADTTAETPTGTDPDPTGTTADPDTTVDPGTTVDPDTTVNPETTVDPSTTTGGDDLCARLGGTDGIAQLVTAFLFEVLNDDRVNAYFLRSDLDWGNLGSCVIDQLGEAVGCAGVTYTCKSMLAAHEGLGISTLDFTDFAEDFGKAWDGHKGTNAPDLTDQDKTDVIKVLSDMAPDIVEDGTNDATVYQRVGRKPAVEAVIGDPVTPGSFVANVAADASIVGFFAMSDFDRLKTCLVRQVVGIDGPKTYGLERDDFPPGIDPGPTAMDPCKDMVSVHADLVDPGDMMGIEAVDFNALVVALVNAMTTAGVTMEDQNLIAGALLPLCPSIVTVDPDNCP